MDENGSEIAKAESRTSMLSSFVFKIGKCVERNLLVFVWTNNCRLISLADWYGIENVYKHCKNCYISGSIMVEWNVYAFSIACLHPQFWWWFHWLAVVQRSKPRHFKLRVMGSSLVPLLVNNHIWHGPPPENNSLSSAIFAKLKR